MGLFGVMGNKLFCKSILGAAVFSVLLSGCSGGDENRKDTEVETAASEEQDQKAEIVYKPQLLSVLPDEAVLLLQKEKDALVVDVRISPELQNLRLPGSVQVSLTDIMQGQEHLPRDKPLLLVCAVGGRSYGAGLYLLKNGYSRLYSLRGGIAAWERAGLVLETGGQ